MPLEYKCPLYAGDVFEGEVQGLYVQAHVFSEPSSYGISEGRISRLTVYPNRQKEFSKRLANYDRGWDGMPPEDSTIRAVIEVVVQQFDHKAVDRQFEALR
ncbi:MULTISPECIES: DUF7678 domain-containing protein [Paenibacillus]|uniref:DUF7678 domain-containing protein n=1 Tax=Paenibacillus TaxID=44249 RepID=UPI00096FAC90|nr:MULTISPECIES: hypothetical protein [Paenibacillus]OMD26812.1 hypothetical protein BJP48_21835 [Paenibacillus odorifer]OME15306.1 hypothetical protein BSK60_11440 [Paenibacillus odorifer]OMF89813.1 hypothetical protein BK147_24880 [Paenibacillus sp. FSL R7-0337]